MSRSLHRSLVAALVVASTATACLHDFDQFEGQGAGGGDASTTPTTDGATTSDGAVKADAGRTDASADAAPVDCTSKKTCYSVAQTCQNACDATQTACLDACNTNGCKNRCKQDAQNCAASCTSTCKQCAGDPCGATCP